MEKRFLGIEAFELTLPDNYEEIVKNGDNLLAELLIRYYLEQTKHLTNKESDIY